MKFLQEQHQATLVALHQEIECLRQRNRGNRDKLALHEYLASNLFYKRFITSADLQFQLVFSKRAHHGAASSPSSPEDNGNGFAKSKVLATI